MQNHFYVYILKCKNGDNKSGIELLKKSFEMDPFLDGSLAVEGKQILLKPVAGI